MSKVSFRSLYSRRIKRITKADVEVFVENGRCNIGPPFRGSRATLCNSRARIDHRNRSLFERLEGKVENIGKFREIQRKTDIGEQIR